MPTKPKKPCSYPSCPNLTDDTYCLEHKKLMSWQYEMYERDPLTRKRYGKEWSRIRKVYVASHPLCEMCLENGVYVKVEEVHHILPVRDGGTHDEENLMSLCKSCHMKVHGVMKTRSHNGREYAYPEKF